jgi:PTH1 family peptidyl-tRNA hydrolase
MAAVETWFLIVGLGNPGSDYAQTRHNAGFMLVDRLAAQWKVAWSGQRRFQAQLARLEDGARRLMLCKPETFMNSSGESVGPLAAYFKIPLEKILVVVDDADLPLGELRLRPGGSSGGHHGLESIEQHLGSRDYARLRIGIGRDPGGARQIAGYVLSSFKKDELELVEKVLQTAAEQVECWLASGVGPAMNKFNGVVKV